MMTTTNVPPAVRRESLERLRREIGETVFEEVLAAYLSESPGRVARIVEAAATGELAQVARAAHGLKSTSGVLGAETLTAVVDLIEGHARANRLAETRAHVVNLTVVYGEAERALRAELGTRP